MPRSADYERVKQLYRNKTVPQELEGLRRATMNALCLAPGL